LVIGEDDYDVRQALVGETGSDARRQEWCEERERDEDAESGFHPKRF
jgi:hypothetical protein